MRAFGIRQKTSPPTPVSGLGIVLDGLRRLLSPLGRHAKTAGALEHLASLPLTAQSSLALVRLHKETLLLGITPQSVTLLTKGHDDALADAATPASPISERVKR